ncbi:MAG TPA: hypothetical protein VN814_06800 [Caulobacteraceae bacterium]|nr:hypothetical protein [Caulobacteraceae bacterium]
MKHAGAAALDRLEPLLARIRTHAALKEKSRGCFYLKRRGLVHFHEDPAGMFADLSTPDGQDDRLKVDDADGADELLRRIADILGPGA